MVAVATDSKSPSPTASPESSKATTSGAQTASGVFARESRTTAGAIVSMSASETQVAASWPE